MGDGGVAAGGRVGRKDIQLIRFGVVFFFISSCSDFHKAPRIGLIADGRLCSSSSQRKASVERPSGPHGGISQLVHTEPME